MFSNVNLHFQVFDILNSIIYYMHSKYIHQSTNFNLHIDFKINILYHYQYYLK